MPDGTPMLSPDLRYRSPMTTITRPAGPDDVPAAARTLARAFDKSPWTRWSVPEDAYGERLEELQSLYLHHALEHGTVLIAQQALGAAALLPPDAPEPGPGAQQRIVQLLGDRLAAVADADRPAAPEETWELATLGVDPQHWGRGIASALLDACWQRTDALGAPVALQTSDPRTVALYERHGFHVVDHRSIPGGPEVWAMLREPQSLDAR